MSIHVKKDYINKGGDWANYVSHFNIPKSNYTPVPKNGKCVICGYLLNTHNHCIICNAKYGEIKNIKKFSTLSTNVATNDIKKPTIFVSKTVLIESTFCNHCGSQDLRPMHNSTSMVHENNFKRLYIIDSIFRAFVLTGARQVIVRKDSKKIILDLKTLNTDIIFDRQRIFDMICRNCGTQCNARSHRQNSLHVFEKMKKFKTLMKRDNIDSFISFYFKVMYNSPQYMQNMEFMMKKVVGVNVLSLFLNSKVNDYCKRRFKNDDDYTILISRLNELLEKKLCEISKS